MDRRSRENIKLKVLAEKDFRKQLLISVERGGRHQKVLCPGCECRSNFKTCVSKLKLFVNRGAEDCCSKRSRDIMSNVLVACSRQWDFAAKP